MDTQAVRKAQAPGVFRPVDLEREARRIQDHSELADVHEDLRQIDAKMVGALTTIFIAWRRFVGFFVFVTVGIRSIEDRLRSHKQRLDGYDARLAELEREKKCSCGPK